MIPPGGMEITAECNFRFIQKYLVTRQLQYCSTGCQKRQSVLCLWKILWNANKELVAVEILIKIPKERDVTLQNYVCVRVHACVRVCKETSSWILCKLNLCKGSMLSRDHSFRHQVNSQECLEQSK